MQISNWKSRNTLVIILVLQFMIFGLVFLDIPIARQVIGFIYLTFIPGMILLRILKLDKLDTAEKILLSVGLSIAFLMFIGLLINELIPLIGFSKPLSQVPLMVILNGLLLLLCFLSYLRDKDFRFPPIENFNFSPSTILFICLPLLGVIGALLVNAYTNNSILLLMIITISGLIVLGTLSKKLIPPKFYPLALLMIAMALLFHTSLISNYLYGHDIQCEYYIFKLTENDSHWNSTIPYIGLGYAKANAMLSVTVLPSIYSSILNMEGIWVLKIIYPLIFSFVPLGLYQLYRTQPMGKKVAFLSTFFFMANDMFFTELLSVTRQMVAELFYILLFFTLFNKKMKPLSKKICFIIFTFALVVSHYAISYIFLFLTFFAWLSLFFLKNNKTRTITASSIALFFIILFSWNIYVSRSGTFNGLVIVMNNVFRNFFAEFFNPESRSVLVLEGLGMRSAPTLGHLIGRIFAYATEFFIVIGFTTLIIKQIKQKNAIFDPEYLVTLSLNIALLFIGIAIPFFPALGMARFYHVLLFFLAPLFIIGVKILSRFLFRLKTGSYVLALVLIILIPFFLYQTQLIYEVTGDRSSSIPLSMYRMDAIRYGLAGLAAEQDVFGAKWLSRNINIEHVTVYADFSSRAFVLYSYGMIQEDRMEVLDNTTAMLTNGTVYLRRINIINKVILLERTSMPKAIDWYNISEISSALNNMNKIYSNGGSEIYKN